MKRFTLILLLSALFLFGCSSVSQSDYDALLEENNQLEEENAQLEERNTQLEEKNKQLEEFRKEQALSEMKEGHIRAWAATSFGDDTICLIDGDSYCQCFAGTTYDISESGITELWFDLLESVTLLGDFSQDITYETISIKFNDPSNICFLEVTLKKDGDSCSLDSILCNALYSEQIISALGNVVSSK